MAVKRVPISLNDQDLIELAHYKRATEQTKDAPTAYQLFKRGLKAWKKENPLRDIAVQSSLEL